MLARKRSVIVKKVIWFFDPAAVCVQYMKWAGIPPSQEDTFWTNPTVRNLIKNDYKVLVTRKNTFNGKRYGEDETIFAWDIYNVSARSPDCFNQHV